MKSAEILNRLEGRQVLIAGDVMLDRYLTGSVTRISPEAPVPVVLHDRTEDRLGGAANVALNVKALGGIPLLCSVIGRDADGEALARLLPEADLLTEGLVSSGERRTTVKTRVLGNNQQMLRIDAEHTHDLGEREETDYLKCIHHLLDTRKIEVIILQDYNKGVLTPRVIQSIIQTAQKRGIPTAVDPKKSNFFAFRGVDLFKPNLKEIRDSAPFPIRAEAESLLQAAEFLRERLGNRLTMITLSERGLYLHDGPGGGGHLYPTIPRAVADVSGAGDTVISIAALGLAAGLPLAAIAVLSNLAGGQVCEFSGVVPVQRRLLEEELQMWILEKKEGYEAFITK